MKQKEGFHPRFIINDSKTGRFECSIRLPNLIMIADMQEKNKINDDRSEINDDRSEINDDRSEINDDRSEINDDRSEINDDMEE